MNMTHTLVSASVEAFPPWADLNLALLFGLIILGGALGARLFQRFHIPQVVGCVVVGILLGGDVAEPVRDKTTPDKPLEEVIEQMRMYHLENVPVVAGKDSDELVGVLDYSKVLRKISAEVLHKREKADGLAMVTG